MNLPVHPDVDLGKAQEITRFIKNLCWRTSAARPKSLGFIEIIKGLGAEKRFLTGFFNFWAQAPELLGPSPRKEPRPRTLQRPQKP
jgi:hypothetical protein